MDKKKILDNIAELSQYRDRLRPKYLRNLRLYTYSMNVSLNQIKSGNIVGYWNLINSEYTSSINENVIQSCIDAITSQVAAKHTRPFFNTINGTYKQMQIAKQAQQFFDFVFDEQDVNKIITEAFRDACIFGRGFVYYDNYTHKVEKALPWQVIYRPAEETYGKITRVLYQKDWFPTTLLPEDLKYKGKEDYVTLSDYYDTVNNVRATLINGQIVKTEPYLAGDIPFIKLSYVSPIYGRDTSSVVDLIYGIQMKLDDLYNLISEASRLNPAHTVIVPQGSDVKVSQLSNKVGQMLTYKPIPDITNPVSIMTPNFIGDQYMQTVEQLKNDAYELVGISKLTAQSKKPTGLDSGKALKTMNDIESERFEVQMKQVIRAYTDLTRLIIKSENPEEFILPADNKRFPITWGQIQEQYTNMSIQFSNLDYLSNDPSERSKQINDLVASGIISRSHAARYFDSVDLEASYSFANNSLNAVEAVIDQAIVNNDFTIPEYIPLDLLCQEIVNTMLSLKAVENEENIKNIENLKLLYKEAVNLKNQIAEQNNQNAATADEQAFQTQLQRQAQEIVNQAQANAQAQVMASNILTNNTGVQ